MEDNTYTPSREELDTLLEDIHDWSAAFQDYGVSRLLKNASDRHICVATQNVKYAIDMQRQRIDLPTWLQEGIMKSDMMENPMIGPCIAVYMARANGYLK